MWSTIRRIVGSSRAWIGQRLHALSIAVSGVRREETGEPVLVYGAGDAGAMVVRDMQATAANRYRPIGFVDDDRSKSGRRIHGVPVLGTSDDLPRIMEERGPPEVLVAIPCAGETTHRSVLRRLDRYNVPVKTLPRLHELRECAVGGFKTLGIFPCRTCCGGGVWGWIWHPRAGYCAVAGSL